MILGSRISGLGAKTCSKDVQQRPASWGNDLACIVGVSFDLDDGNDEDSF
jgi:hypothetical protein